MNKKTRDKDRKWGERRKEEARRKKRAKEERKKSERRANAEKRVKEEKIEGERKQQRKMDAPETARPHQNLRSDADEHDEMGYYPT